MSEEDFISLNIFTSLLHSLPTNRLIVIKTKDGCAAKQRVVHVNITGIIVSVRVPQAPGAHPHALAPLLPYHDLDHDLVAIVAQCLHLALHIIRDCFGPLGHFGGVIHLASQLLIEATVDYFLQRI